MKAATVELSGIVYWFRTSSNASCLIMMAAYVLDAMLVNAICEPALLSVIADKRLRSVVIWDATGYYARSLLLHIQDNHNSNRYIREIL